MDDRSFRLGDRWRYPAFRMEDIKQPNRIVLTLVAVAFVLGLGRGGYLLGWPAGIMLGGILAFSAFLLTDSFRSCTRFKPLRVIAASCFFCFVGALVAVPTLISKDIQYSIDRVANERKMRSELNEVFSNDDRFSSLLPQFTQLKCTNIKLTGSLPDSSSLDDLRAAIGDNCPTVCELALVSWNIRITDSRMQIKVNDGKIGQYRSGDNNAG